MEPSSTIEAYKRDTKHVLKWMIRSTKEIIRSSPTQQQDLRLDDDGETTVSELLLMSHLLAERAGSVSPMIFRLLRSTISARSAVHRSFCNLNAINPDPAVEASNARHRVFIDSLQSVFRNLGGDSWLSNERLMHRNSQDDSRNEASTLSNPFDMLQLEDVEEADDNDTLKSSLPDSSEPPLNGKEKTKNKKKKRRKKIWPTKAPPENDGLIADGHVSTKYLAVVHVLIGAWVELRFHAQRLWKSVAYEGNVGGVISSGSLASISLIKDLASLVFIGFPDHDSYYTMINAVTRGQSVSANQTELPKIASDLEEQFLIPTYGALMEFLHDFRQKRDRLPSKRMMKKLRKWNPNLDLARATEQQRLDWRRLYTIAWLYDMVNVCSSPFFNDRKAEIVDLTGIENQDWSPRGPYRHRVRLYDLDGFAGEITHMAFQKPSTDVRPMILPHHVFQLQCIVDSFTVSKGWSFDCAYNHLLEPPPQDFYIKEDLEIFLGLRLRDTGVYNTGMRGFLADGKRLHERLVGHPDQTKCPSYRAMSATLGTIIRDFEPLAGPFRARKVAPSCFFDSKSFGFWDYSPFLCGIGLISAIEIAYKMGQRMLDTMHEPIGIIRIHSALLQKGYLKQPVELVQGLQNMFEKNIFHESQVPTSHFEQSLSSYYRLGGTPTLWKAFCNQKTWEGMLRVMGNIPGVSLLNVVSLENNRYFNTAPFLTRLSRDNWQVVQPQGGTSNMSLNKDLRSYIDGHTADAAETKDGRTRRKSRRSRRLASRNAHDHANKEHTSPAQTQYDDATDARYCIDKAMNVISDELWGPAPKSGLNYMWVVHELVDFHAQMDFRFRRHFFPAGADNHHIALDFTCRALDCIEHPRNDSDRDFIMNLVAMFEASPPGLYEKCYWQSEI